MRTARRAKQTAVAMKMIIRMMKKKKKGKVGKWTLQVEKSPWGHQTCRVQQIPHQTLRVQQIPRTPLERATHE
jgi:hypothetical protein